MKDLDGRLKDWGETRVASDPSAGSTASLIRAASKARPSSPWLRLLVLVPVFVGGWLILRDDERPPPAPQPPSITAGYQIGAAVLEEDRVAVAEGRLNFEAGIDDYALDRRSELSLLEEDRWELVKGTLAVKRQSGKGGRAPLTVVVRGQEVELRSSGKFLIRNEAEGEPLVWAQGAAQVPEGIEFRRGGIEAFEDERLWHWLIEEEPRATHIPAEGQRGMVGVDTMLVGTEAWTEVLIYGRRIEVLSGAVAIDTFEEVSLIYGPNAHVVGPGTFTGDAREGAFVVGEDDPLGLLGERSGPALYYPGEAWLDLAELHEQQGDSQAAREAYEGALRQGIKEQRLRARLGLGSLEARLDRPEAAMAHYNAALDDGAGELENEVRLRLIVLLEDAGREDEAELHRSLLR